MMTKNGKALAAIVAALLLAALPAAAEHYTIKLVNGNSFDSLYKPRLAAEGSDTVLVSTDVGNWISLPIDAIESVTSQIEARGFGKVINTTTILIGSAPNDAELPDEGEQEMDPAARLLDFLESQQQAQQPTPFSVQQFAEPNTGGGIPLGFTNVTTPPMGAPVAVEPPVVGDGN